MVMESVNSWKVAFYDQNNVGEDEEESDFGSLSFFDSYENAVAAGMEDAEVTFWPNLIQNKEMRLDRCTRLFPQDHDTGGFFLALIRGSVEWENISVVQIYCNYYR
jgi:hypothetical protein